MNTVLKKLSLAFVLSGSAAAASFAGSPLIPLPAFGEDAGISVLASATMAYNDNLYLDNSNEESDVIYTLSPGFEFTTGDKGRTRATFRFVENFVIYNDNDDDNRALENADFTLAHGADGDKLRLTVAAGFHHNQSSSSRERVDGKGTMTRSYNYYGNAIASYKLGEKLSVRSGFKWTGTTYIGGHSRTNYNDRQQYAIPLYLYYAVTEKLNAGFTAEYRYVDLKSSKNNRSKGKAPGYQQVWFLGLSADGHAWEKLSLSGRVGYTTSDYSRRTVYSNNDRENSLGASITANYKATEKLSTSLTVNRDFEIGGAAEDILSTGVSLGAVYRITDFWAANASVGYTRDAYQDYDRDDDIYRFSVGASYAINDYTSAFASYSFSKNDSDSNTSQNYDYGYTNNVVTIGISFRY